MGVFEHLTEIGSQFSQIFGQNMGKTVDDRSATAKAMSRVSDVMSICLLMIIPALIGYGLDQWFGTRFLLTIIGLVFGMTGAVLLLMQLVAALQKSDDPTSVDPDEPN